ncbi:MAG: hypothetical protein HY606_13735, partial [Planctomycetes bacterium]|nr:hypothetical protein [Planctomycetota bacterium]
MKKKVGFSVIMAIVSFVLLMSVSGNVLAGKIAAVCDDDFVRVWTGGGTLLYTTGIGTEPGLYPVSVAIGDVAAAPGNEILTADSDAVIRVWNGTTGAYITDLINLQSGGS